MNAESTEDAESKAYEVVENEAYYGGGTPGVLDLAEYGFLDIRGLDINTYDATPVDDEEDEKDAQPDTAKEISA